MRDGGKGACFSSSGVRGVLNPHPAWPLVDGALVVSKGGASPSQFADFGARAVAASEVGLSYVSCWIDVILKMQNLNSHN